MKTNKIIATIILMFATLLLLCTNANAAYQSKPTTDGTLRQTPDLWIIGIREMEKSGQGMGLNETVDTTTGLATSDSNNIDVHMLKNTEYGAIVLLGASDYGKQGTGQDRWMTQGGTETLGTATNLATTTGNITGVYEIGYRDMTQSSSNVEWVAGGLDTFLSNIDNRYVNRYTTSEDSAKAGDATVETKYWHGTGSEFYWVASDGCGFLRGYSNANRGAFYSNYDSVTTSSYARTGVVCGTGF